MSAFSTRRLQALTLCAAAALASGAAGAQSLTPTRRARSLATPTSTASRSSTTTASMHSYFVDRGGPDSRRRWNQIHNKARVYTPEDTAIQTPNSDTPYSCSAPTCAPSRWSSPCLPSMRSATTRCSSSTSTPSTSPTSAAAPPATAPAAIFWPARAGRARRPRNQGGDPLRDRTSAWCSTAPSCSMPATSTAVKKIQAGYKVQPLSAFLGKPAAGTGPALDFIRPLSVRAAAYLARFFEVLNFILRSVRRPPSERHCAARFAGWASGPAADFKAEALTPETARGGRGRHGRCLEAVRSRSRRRTWTPASEQRQRASARASS